MSLSSFFLHTVKWFHLFLSLYKWFYLLLIIFLHKVKCFQVLLLTLISKISDCCWGWPRRLHLIATTLRCRGGCYSILWIAPLYSYLIMLSVKQGGIKYHFFFFFFFLNLWYNSTWDWTLVSQTIGEHYSLGQWPGLII